ncbi:MAG: Hydroxyacylglutathione hydrolase [Firmicutes bacterium ADurb.Bin456]|nr:MAG: Hydroxyacylglutathione hydrolase [Firmicutes bacterium ADurb.Bin456]
MSAITPLGCRIHQVDVREQGKTERTSCYIIDTENVAIIETGASPGTVYLMDALGNLGIASQRVKYIIVTHVHLDHSGGAGQLARELPEARIIAHPRGARHLLDPSRLVAGARPLYGERFDEFYGEVLPVPADRVHTPEDGETLELEEGRTLTIYHTPGHARHHLVVNDPASKGLFSGDAVGARYPALSRLIERDYILPLTPPSEFDPPAFVETLERLGSLGAENIFFTHFGRATGVESIFPRVRELVITFAEIGRSILDSGGGAREIEATLWELVLGELSQYGEIDRNHPFLEYLESDMELSAAGIVHYFQRMKKG